MTTPADHTPLAILQEAYTQAGLLQQGNMLDGEQIARGMRVMISLINLWQTQGLKLWLLQDVAITLVADTGLYTLGPSGTVVMTKPLRVLEAYHLDSSGVRRPLNPISWAEYVRLSQVTQSGTINSYHVDKQATTLNVFFWNPPDSTDATGTAHLLLQQQVTNFTNFNETVNFPAEWNLALIWGVADELCTGQPQAIMDRCAQRALAYRNALDDWDVEDADTRFAPEFHGHQGGAFQ